MRTTLTLEPDIARRLKELVHREQKSFKQIVNEVIRDGLNLHNKPKSPEKPFTLSVYPCRFKPGVDVRKFNQLLDELEVEDFIHEQNIVRKK